jgi:hypothetical protein
MICHGAGVKDADATTFAASVGTTAGSDVATRKAGKGADDAERMLDCVVPYDGLFRASSLEWEAVEDRLLHEHGRAEFPKRMIYISNRCTALGRQCVINTIPEGGSPRDPAKTATCQRYSS